MAEALASGMDATGLAQAVLLGTSQGRQIIAELATRQPRWIARTMLVGSAVGPGGPNAGSSWDVCVHALVLLLVLVHLVSDHLAAMITKFRLVLLHVFSEALLVSLDDNDHPLIGGFAVAHRLVVVRIRLSLFKQWSAQPERLLDGVRSSPSRIGG